MIVDAWQDSANTPIVYPMVNVRDIESGKVRVTRDVWGGLSALTKHTCGRIVVVNVGL